MSRTLHRRMRRRQRLAGMEPRRLFSIQADRWIQHNENSWTLTFDHERQLRVLDFSSTKPGRMK